MTQPEHATHDDSATPAEDADQAVLAGEPGSASQLERGDDDPPPVEGEWAAADALLEGQPTALGE